MCLKEVLDEKNTILTKLKKRDEKSVILEFENKEIKVPVKTLDNELKEGEEVYLHIVSGSKHAHEKNELAKAILNQILIPR